MATRSVMTIIARLNVGGPAIHTILLTEQFARRGWDAQLVCGQIGAHEGDMSYLAESKGVEPIIVEALGREINPLADIATVTTLYRLMRHHRPTVVHTHTSKAGFVGRIAAWLAGVPVRVHTFHGHVFHGYFSPLKTRLFIWIERILARLTSRIITISPELRDELVDVYRIGPPEAFEVVPLGLDLRALAATPDPGFRRAHNLPRDKRLVGIIGRLVPIKNHTLFLQVAQHIERDDVHFVIVGDGECRPELEQQVRAMGVGDRVTFIGWVQDIGSVLAELDALMLTSANEGTPTALIEAMAAGVPVVATAVGGVPDTLAHGRYGHLAPPGDVKALVGALERTLAGDHADLDEVREAMFARYGLGPLINRLEAIYNA